MKNQNCLFYRDCKEVGERDGVAVRIMSKIWGFFGGIWRGLEEKRDGQFVLLTTREELAASKVVDSYKNLKEVEMLFDDLKHFLKPTSAAMENDPLF